MCRYATFRAAQKIAPNIVMFLPRTVDVTQVEELSWLSCPPLDFEVCFLFNSVIKLPAFSRELLCFKTCLISDHSRVKRTTCTADSKESLPILEDDEITEPIVKIGMSTEVFPGSC